LEFFQDIESQLAFINKQGVAHMSVINQNTIRLSNGVILNRDTTKESMREFVARGQEEERALRN